MRQEGITADREIARGFAYEGYENLREGNYERAREAFDLARSFDPYLPQAQAGYAWGLLRAGRGFFTFVNEYRRGMGLAWAQFVTDEIQLSNLAVIMALAILASLLVSSLVIVARCQGRARHDLFESLRRALPEGWARFGSLVIFFLPLLFWIGGFWLILFWLVLCFRYMRTAEKLVAASVFLMIGLSPIGASIVLDRFEASTDPEVRLVVSAMQGGYNPDTLRRLRKIVEAHESNSDLRLLLGNAYAQGDMLAEAFDEYKAALELNPTHTAALVNLGNVYYRLGEYAQAVVSYKQAGQIQPDMVSSYWNMHLAQTELLHFAEAEESLARAREIDRGLTGDLLSQKKIGGSPLLEEPGDLSRIKSDLRAGGPLLDQGHRAFANPLSIAGAVGLILALILGVGAQPSLAQSCQRCARAYCRRCQLDKGATGCCARCVHLFYKKDGITSETRSEGLARLERRDLIGRSVRRLLSLSLPGSAQLLSGRIGLGLPLLTGWCSAIIYLATRDRLLTTSRVPVTDFPPAIAVAVGIAMVALWITANTVSVHRWVPSAMSTHGS